MQLHGPDGTYVLVTNEHKLAVYSVTENVQQHINHDHNKLFSMVFDQAAANAAADELLLYMQNAADELLVIFEINITISAANIVYCKINDSGTVGGSPTAITPASLNGDRNESAEGTFYSDDAMSGLSGGNIVIWEYLLADQENKNICPSGNVVLGKNGTFTLYVETQQAQTIQGYIVFGYYSEDDYL